MPMLWINRSAFSVSSVFYVLPLVALTALFCTGCASSVNKVVNKKAPTMEQVYDRYTGHNPAKIAERKAELLRRPAVNEDNQLGLPPYPERLDHLYPRLANPDLFMYVRPHAIGLTGSPVPAYITRFSMYERQPYALPGETLETLKVHVDDQLMQARIREEQRQAALKKQGKSKSTSAHANLDPLGDL